MMEEQKEYEVKELEFTPVHTTCANGGHQWVPGGTDQLSGMSSEVCANCWIGRSASILKA
jgi:hypothetical protein